jgi:hypothetical protein
MCKTFEKLRELGVWELHISQSHRGKITLADLKKAYPEICFHWNDEKEIFEPRSD